ncbi:MAG: hypothetical protein NTY35_02520 [Planctomycetota bacterium]|nr:hypothetical protein [Planctomycetota bacterium]
MKSFVTVLGLLALGACNSSNNDDAQDTGPTGNSLVESLIIDNTTDSAEPVDINDLDLQFSEDENAFSGLFE